MLLIMLIYDKEDEEYVAAVDNIDMLSHYTPTYIPEGFTLVEVLETDTRYKLYYENSIAERITFEIQVIKDQTHVNVNTEDSELIEIPLITW